MAGPNFGSVLDKPTTDIERPKPIPQGTYVLAVQGMPRFDKSTKKQTEFVEFTCKILQAGEDVDEDELKAMGGIGDKTLKHTFYLTENSIYRLKEFLIDDLKLEEEDTLRPMIEKAIGAQFVAQIKHTPSDDGKSVYSNIASTGPTE